MKILFHFFLLCRVSSIVRHSSKFFVFAPYGLQDLADTVAVAMVDDVQIAYCDSRTKIVEFKHEWTKEFLKTNPEFLLWSTKECLGHQYLFRAHLDNIMQRFNQSGGVHILQRMSGCEWDEETGEIVGFSQYGYDGEDFLALDLRTMSWVAPNPKAFMTKLRWDADKPRLEHNKILYIHKCPNRLKHFLDYTRSYLNRRVLPSISLLQKSPSSPVRCFSTGFYPDRAVMFWRKDGEEIHEGVDHEEILPNHDQTFQMSADLNISSVKPEDWERYECVFQLDGVEEDIVTRLDKSNIRSNTGSPSGFPVALVAGVASCLLLLLLCTIGLWKWRKNLCDFQPDNREQSTPEEETELSEESQQFQD